MTLTEIKIIAKDHKVKIGKKKKAELIQNIQNAEGNYACFGTADGSCDQNDCLWRTDCLK